MCRLNYYLKLSLILIFCSCQSGSEKQYLVQNDLHHIEAIVEFPSFYKFIKELSTNNSGKKVWSFNIGTVSIENNFTGNHFSIDSISIDFLIHNYKQHNEYISTHYNEHLLFMKNISRSKNRATISKAYYFKNKEEVVIYRTFYFEECIISISETRMQKIASLDELTKIKLDEINVDLKKYEKFSKY